MPNENPPTAGAADSFDVIVIGGGPAGYPAAIRAAQNRLSVACIDEWKNRDGTPAFGGTCLNAGCIPSKALLESSELYHRVQEEFAVHGIMVAGATLDLAQMQKRKSGVVRGMTQGILALFKAAGVIALAGPRQAPRRSQGASSPLTTALGACSAPSRWCSPPGPRRSSCAPRPSSRPRSWTPGGRLIWMPYRSVWR